MVASNTGFLLFMCTFKKSPQCQLERSLSFSILSHNQVNYYHIHFQYLGLVVICHNLHDTLRKLYFLFWEAAQMHDYFLLTQPGPHSEEYCM